MNHSLDDVPPKAHSETLALTTKLSYGLGELAWELPNNILVFYLLFFLTTVAAEDTVARIYLHRCQGINK